MPDVLAPRNRLHAGATYLFPRHWYDVSIQLGSNGVPAVVRVAMVTVGEVLESYIDAGRGGRVSLWKRQGGWELLRRDSTVASLVREAEGRGGQGVRLRVER
ncbi:hypothetical protein B0A55_01629 [Friedmanniomyces simplex]|uniref:Uncharacterized protein n=1 Tax=Friedmanniomyces simplex TaxID=329884 RepID=A0A4U0XZJ3_9PEZI|nr:hypothetical protein B0A55_01629 [Friedmanniomyces simplex]